MNGPRRLALTFLFLLPASMSSSSWCFHLISPTPAHVLSCEALLKALPYAYLLMSKKLSASSELELSAYIQLKDQVILTGLQHVPGYWQRVRIDPRFLLRTMKYESYVEYGCYSPYVKVHRRSMGFIDVATSDRKRKSPSSAPALALLSAVSSQLAAAPSLSPPPQPPSQPAEPVLYKKRKTIWYDKADSELESVVIEEWGPKDCSLLDDLKPWANACPTQLALPSKLSSWPMGPETMNTIATDAAGITVYTRTETMFPATSTDCHTYDTLQYKQEQSR